MNLLPVCFFSEVVSRETCGVTLCDLRIGSVGLPNELEGLVTMLNAFALVKTRGVFDTEFMTVCIVDTPIGAFEIGFAFWLTFGVVLFDISQFVLGVVSFND